MESKVRNIQSREDIDMICDEVWHMEKGKLTKEM